MHNYGCIGGIGDCIIITKAPTGTVGAKLTIFKITDLRERVLRKLLSMQTDLPEDRLR